MVIELSDEQRIALNAGQTVPIQDGSRTFYIVPGEQFERLKVLLEVEQADPSFYEAGEIHLYEDQ